MKRLAAIAFALVALPAALFAKSDNLVYGEPGKADRVIDREGYALGYSSAWKIPKWIAYRLTAAEVTDQVVGRIDDFRPDPQIPYGPQLEDYRGSGYDRGHMAPAADMKWSEKAMRECFYLSNMCPQDRRNNSGIWNEIENAVRGFACAEGSVFVVTGPIFFGKGPADTIGAGKVAVPDGFYKVVYDETPPEKMIAFMVRNQPMTGKPKDHSCSVETIEKATGMKFFPKLPAEKLALKSDCRPQAWNWSKSQKVRAKRIEEPAATGFVPGSFATGEREEYLAGSSQPVSGRKAAPVCDKWPDTGFWLNTNTNKRHNRKCPNYRKTRGYPCQKDEGSPCGICGG